MSNSIEFRYSPQSRCLGRNTLMLLWWQTGVLCRQLILAFWYPCPRVRWRHKPENQRETQVMSEISFITTWSKKSVWKIGVRSIPPGLTFRSENYSSRWIADGADQVFLVVRAVKRNWHSVHPGHNAAEDDWIGLHFVPEEYLVAGLVVSRAAVVQQGGKSHVGVVNWRGAALAMFQMQRI